MPVPSLTPLPCMAMCHESTHPPQPHSKLSRHALAGTSVPVRVPGHRGYNISGQSIRPRLLPATARRTGQASGGACRWSYKTVPRGTPNIKLLCEWRKCELSWPSSCSEVVSMFRISLSLGSFQPNRRMGVRNTAQQIVPTL